MFVRFGTICMISRAATPYIELTLIHISHKSVESAESSRRDMSFYKQVPVERLSGLSG